MVTIVVYLVLLILLTPLLGAYMYRVYRREEIGRVEGLVYRLIGVNPQVEQSWRRYATSCLLFSFFSMVLLYVLFRVQGSLPLNPVGLGAVDKYVAFNTASSFTTNTNWQAYGGETTMTLPHPDARPHVPELRVGGGRDGGARRPLPRVHPLPSGRDRQLLAGHSSAGPSTSCSRSPAIVAVVLITQGVVQTLGSSVSATGIQGFEQTLARGPVAGQIAIKQLGTNGGGFFNVNSAHPFEGGIGPFGNFIGMFSILLDPGGVDVHVRQVGRQRASGLGDLRGDDGAVHRRGSPSRFRRSTGHRRRCGRPASRPPPRTWRARRSGSGPTSPRCGPSRRPPRRTAASTRCTTRTGPSGQLAPMFNIGDRRGDLGRRRQRPVRDDLLRRHRRLHRRADGRTDPRVPREEDRRPRGQARRRSPCWCRSSSCSA